MKLESASGDSSNHATQLYAGPPGLAHPFRVTLVTPERVPAWLSSFVDIASTTAWIELTVLPVNGAKLPAVSGVPLDLRALLAIERARRRINATLSAVRIHARDRVAIGPEVQASAEPAQLREQISALQPDVILSLGPRSWAETLADGAPWGCWNLDANLIDHNHAGLALLAPVLKNAPATEIELELLTASHAPVSAGASWGATQPHSFHVQRERAFLKLPLLLLRLLQRLAAGELQAPRRRAATLRLAPPESPLGFAAGVRALAITLYGTAQLQLKKRRRLPPWLLMLRQGPEALDPGAPEARSSVVLQAPPGGFWADPCAVEASGRKLVFVEEITPQSLKKGTIACLELRPGGARRLGVALEDAVHLSYPQVFEWDAQWYLTVESSRAKRVSLYRATEFPLGWERIADLVSGRVCVDPTLHFHQGHWYLFATIAENGNSTWDELFLFVADQLTGPFRPHPANPILSDVRRARPAGRLFCHEGRLIRPSQDCASRYGAAVVFNEILELSPTRYRERSLSRLAPDWTRACHTYSRSGGVEVLDARGDPAADMPRLAVTEAAIEPALVEPAMTARIEENLMTHAKPVDV